MAVLLLILGLVALAAAAPFMGTDTTDARAENARPDAGWFPLEDDSTRISA
jgi:hypothetical protein